VRVNGRWVYLSRDIDEAGPVIDVLPREHRELDSAKAFLALAIERRGVTLPAGSTDGHQADQRAGGKEAPEADQMVTGLHRTPGHPTTQPMERSHGPVKDQVRPLRGLQSMVTGHQLMEGMRVAQAIQRGDGAHGGGGRRLAGEMHQAS
jgi:transposase-like protein